MGATMLRLVTVLALLPVCFCYLPAFPPLWSSSAGGIDHFPRNGSAISVNAWNYSHRLAMYHELLDRTGDHCLWQKDPKHLGNPVWGLPLQHGWQEFSGRLGINATQDASNTGLAPATWWACANY